MGPTWLWQNVISNAVYAILILGGGVVIGVLKKKKPEIAGPVMYTIAAIACLTVIFFMVTGRALLSSTGPITTFDNIEGSIKTWADDMSLPIGRGGDDKTEFWGYTIVQPSGVSVEVSRTKDRPNYLQFRNKISFSAEHLAALNKMDKATRELAINEVILPLAISKTSFVMGGGTDKDGRFTEMTVIITESHRITQEFSEDDFLTGLDKVALETRLLQSAVTIAIAKYSATPKLRAQ